MPATIPMRCLRLGRRSVQRVGFVNSLCCCSLLFCYYQKNAWQSRKDIVNLTADVVRIKASAEQFEDQGPACPRALRKLLPAISSTLSLDRSLSHSENAG